MKFDISSMYIADDPKRYYIIVSANHLSKFAKNQMFDIFEFHYLLKQITTALQYMIPFYFHKYILYDQRLDVTKMNFFKRYEILGGQTISDLYIKNPTMISKALQQDLK